MQDGRYIGLGRSPSPKEIPQTLEAGDRVQVRRGLGPSNASVKVTPDAGMPGVSGKLADMVDMIADALQRDPAFAAPDRKSARSTAATMRPTPIVVGSRSSRPARARGPRRRPAARDW